MMQHGELSANNTDAIIRGASIAPSGLLLPA